MQVCVEEAPPLFNTDPHRVTACYLYREAPTASAEQLADVFVGGGNGAADPAV